jgi:hypothetical protein
MENLMPRFTIIGIASATKVLGVIEAPTKKDAEDIAWNDDMLHDEWYISLCHHCASDLDVGDIYKIEASEND